VDAKHIVLATLHALAREKKIESKTLNQAIKELGINPEKANPTSS
jgi:pyruvate dehydrogenase complex dehydrogenase (E1) component